MNKCILQIPDVDRSIDQKLQKEYQT